MSAIQCLVTYGTHKIVVTVDGEHRRPDLIRCLAQKQVFEGVDLEPSHIMVYHAGFETDVDLTDDMILEDKALLKVVQDEQQFRIMDVIMQDDPGTSRAPSKKSSEYKLPPVPLDITQAMRKHTKGHYVGCRSRLIQWLYHDLCLYDMYPDKLYEKAAKCLVDMFPTLADTTGSGHDSWRLALRFKAKRERVKLRQTEEGYGENGAPPRKQQKQARVPKDPKPKRVTRPGTNIVLPADGEDEESFQGHVLGMDKEMQKSSPNVAYITDSLARTFPTRRLWVTSLNPSVAEIVEKYPALKCGTFLQQEFTAATGCTIEDKLLEGLSNSSLRILEAARKKRHLAAFFDDLDGRAAGVDAGPENDVLTMAALYVLPCLVKERSLTFLHPDDPAELPPYPTVGYEGDFYQAASFIVSVDELRIEEATLLGAISTMMAMYWVFNMEFLPKSSKTLQLLSHMVGVDCALAASPLVLVAKGIIDG
ncbi:uncharacterized protein LOC8050653 [Ixodes scapularis]|uniref:uncharacterized protein LOC8050653 n=1 Tax=Ixodes scapularis TaxID=6945 RepID=UPI001C38A600|nr:uncharacterized protein LOC8050653 [Ixodes scapularis]